MVWTNEQRGGNLSGKLQGIASVFIKPFNTQISHSNKRADIYSWVLVNEKYSGAKKLTNTVLKPTNLKTTDHFILSSAHIILSRKTAKLRRNNSRRPFL